MSSAIRDQLKKMGITGLLADELQAPGPIMNLICNQVSQRLTAL